jgi:thymidylate synthase (FAD)
VTIIEPKVTLEWASPLPEHHIEQATRTAYKSDPSATLESRDQFLRRIIEQYHHESVVEHAVASLRIITDRGITHEIVRHRLASYTQESTRYVNYSKDKHGAGDLRFILPLGLTKVQEAFFLHAFEVEQNMYNDAIDLGCTPQQARDLLPNGVKTEIVMTTNAREWRHFLKLRTAKGAHPKMRVVAYQVLDVLSAWSPLLFNPEVYEPRPVKEVA